MDKLSNYRRLIKDYLTYIVDLVNQQHPAVTSGIDCECVFDEQRDHYLLLNTGWDGNKRVRSTTLHVRLRNGKIWIEDDMTEDGIANELLRQGVPKEDIVLAFHSPSMRKHTDYAVA